MKVFNTRFSLLIFCTVSLLFFSGTVETLSDDIRHNSTFDPGVNNKEHRINNRYHHGLRKNRFHHHRSTRHQRYRHYHNKYHYGHGYEREYRFKNPVHRAYEIRNGISTQLHPYPRYNYRTRDFKPHTYNHHRHHHHNFHR